MRKIVRSIVVCGLIAALCGTWGILADRQKLNEGLIRFHVVANSDRPEDQTIKLQVRDAVLESLREDLSAVSDVEAAKEYLQANLPKIQQLVTQTLEGLAFDGEAVVTLCREEFVVRHYETFSLPSGVYDSLRIVIGAGEGKNWWCVSFPALCVPATTDGFETAAAGAGFSQPLTDALAGEEGYQLRFYFLDRLGQLEKRFFPQ